MVLFFLLLVVVGCCSGVSGLALPTDALALPTDTEVKKVKKVVKSSSLKHILSYQEYEVTPRFIAAYA